MQDDTSSKYRVVPFGNPRIKGHLHLPAAYRSLSRPSSPPRAKASAMRPYLLSFKLTFKYQVSSIGYYPGILNIAVLKTCGSIYTFSSLLNFTFCFIMSKIICIYPRLIAAYHVLHRLREPRHPPCALFYFLRISVPDCSETKTVAHTFSCCY